MYAFDCNKCGQMEPCEVLFVCVCVLCRWQLEAWRKLGAGASCVVLSAIRQKTSSEGGYAVRVRRSIVDISRVTHHASTPRSAPSIDHIDPHERKRQGIDMIINTPSLFIIHTSRVQREQSSIIIHRVSSSIVHHPQSTHAQQDTLAELVREGSHINMDNIREYLLFSIHPRPRAVVVVGQRWDGETDQLVLFRFITR